MAVSGQSDNTNISNDIYTGLENFRVVAVNPSLEQAKALGYNYEKEPEYVSKGKDHETGEEFDRLMLSFYLDNFPEEGEPHIKIPATYFLENRKVVSSTGKTQYTNTKGEFAYLESLDNIPANMEWFDLDGARPAVRGEEMVVRMLRNLLNIDKNGACSIDNPAALFTGNISEIKEMVDLAGENKIGFLLVVKNVDKTDDDGNVIGQSEYQGIYTRKTERPYAKDMSYLNKDITQWQENGGGTKLTIPDPPYALKKWEGVNPDPQPAAANTNW